MAPRWRRCHTGCCCALKRRAACPRITWAGGQYWHEPVAGSAPPKGSLRETGGRARARELEREKQAVLKAIKEIELDHQMRKIADGDYKELIERYRARAMRLISEIEAGDNFRELIERELKDRLSAIPAGAPAAAPRSDADAAVPATATAVPASPTHEKTGCAACGTINDPDAQFCKKCGVKLAA